MFERTGTVWSPSVVVKSNDKREARTGAMKHVLSLFDYPNRNRAVVEAPDPLIAGPAGMVYGHGQTPGGPSRGSVQAVVTSS